MNDTDYGPAKSIIFPYDFRLSLGASENGRAEQSGTRRDG